MRKREKLGLGQKDERNSRSTSQKKSPAKQPDKVKGQWRGGAWKKPK